MLTAWFQICRGAAVFTQVQPETLFSVCEPVYKCSNRPPFLSALASSKSSPLCGPPCKTSHAKRPHKPVSTQHVIPNVSMSHLAFNILCWMSLQVSQHSLSHLQHPHKAVGTQHLILNVSIMPREYKLGGSKLEDPVGHLLLESPRAISLLTHPTLPHTSHSFPLLLPCLVWIPETPKAYLHPNEASLVGSSLYSSSCSWRKSRTCRALSHCKLRKRTSQSASVH